MNLYDITIKTDFIEIQCLYAYWKQHPPTGATVEALLAASILTVLVPKLYQRSEKWKPGKRNLKLQNHEARSIAMFLTKLTQQGIDDEYARACLSLLQHNLLKKMA